MKKMSFTMLLPLAVFSTLALGRCAEIFDLSHNQDEDTIYWPGMPSFVLTNMVRGEVNGVWLDYGQFSSGEHGGTHMDAPNHFIQGNMDLSEIPLELVVGRPGVHIDVSSEVGTNSSYVLTLERVKEWEAEHGPIPQKAAVLVNYGWSTRWPDVNAYFGTDNVSDVTTISFPYISVELAEYLMDVRNMYTLGSDTPSPDDPQTATYPVHNKISGDGKIILENVKFPTTLPATGFELHSAPVKVVNGTGIQVRVHAILDQDGNAATHLRSGLGSVVFSALVGIFCYCCHNLSL